MSPQTATITLISFVEHAVQVIRNRLFCSGFDEARLSTSRSGPSAGPDWRSFRLGSLVARRLRPVGAS